MCGEAGVGTDTARVHAQPGAGLTRMSMPEVQGGAAAPPPGAPTANGGSGSANSLQRTSGECCACEQLVPKRKTNWDAGPHLFSSADLPTAGTAERGETERRQSAAWPSAFNKDRRICVGLTAQHAYHEEVCGLGQRLRRMAASESSSAIHSVGIGVHSTEHTEL